MHGGEKNSYRNDYVKITIKLDKTYTNKYGTGKIHYYMNVRTGKVSYYDAKMKISAQKSIRSGLNNTVTDNDGFWIVDLDENLIPIGVRK